VRFNLLLELRSPATACWWRPHVLLPTELVLSWTVASLLTFCDTSSSTLVSPLL